MRLPLLKMIFRKIALCILFLCCIFLHPCRVHADTGPKASITVTVTNPPEEKYYIDLLEKIDLEDGESAAEYIQERRKSICADDREFLQENDSAADQKMQDILFHYCKDGWYARLDRGIVDSTFHIKNSQHTYDFQYSVPGTFKVILVTAEGNVFVSDEITKRQYNGVFIYDRDSGEIQEKYGSAVLLSVLQMILCFVLTIILEGSLLVVFCLLHEKNFKSFLFINCITQLALNLYIQLVQFVCGGGWLMFMGMMFMEFIIAVVEVCFYYNRLVDVDGTVHKMRNVVYGIVANLCSFLLGVMILNVIWSIAGGIG